MKYTILLASVFASIMCSAEPSGSSPFIWSGDLRYRLAQSRESQDDSRLLNQLRARLGVKAEVNSQMQAILRLATGSSAISTNQTLGDSSSPGMARREFGLDLGYADITLSESLKLAVGRVNNPFWSPNQTQLVYDSDLAFEGASARFEKQWSQTALFFNLGAFLIYENYSSGQDKADLGLLASELGYRFKSSELDGVVRLGFHSFTGLENKLITSTSKTAAIDTYSSPFLRFRGNTVRVNDAALPSDQRRYYFEHSYELLNLGFQLRSKAEWGEWMFFADSAQNTTLAKLNQATELGVQVKPGPYRLVIGYIAKEADSVVGAFTDSDTNGGGTDNLGWKLQVGRQFGQGVQLAYTQVIAKRGVDATERNYTLGYLDFIASF